MLLNGARPKLFLHFENLKYSALASFWIMSHVTVMVTKRDNLFLAKLQYSGTRCKQLGGFLMHLPATKGLPRAIEPFSSFFSLFSSFLTFADELPEKSIYMQVDGRPGGRTAGSGRYGDRRTWVRCCCWPRWCFDLGDRLVTVSE